MPPRKSLHERIPVSSAVKKCDPGIPRTTRELWIEFAQRSYPVDIFCILAASRAGSKGSKCALPAVALLRSTRTLARLKIGLLDLEYR
jgi:hypothetical protein